MFTREIGGGVVEESGEEVKESYGATGEEVVSVEGVKEGSLMCRRVLD